MKQNKMKKVGFNLIKYIKNEKFEKEKHVSTMNTRRHLKLQPLQKTMLTYERHEDK